jgi:hypothetical protein
VISNGRERCYTSTEDDVPWVQIYRRLIVGGIVIGSFGHKPSLHYFCCGDKGQTSAIPTCVIYVCPDRKVSRERFRKFKLDLAGGVCHEAQLFPVTSTHMEGYPANGGLGGLVDVRA